MITRRHLTPRRYSVTTYRYRKRWLILILSFCIVIRHTKLNMGFVPVQNVYCSPNTRAPHETQLLYTRWQPRICIVFAPWVVLSLDLRAAAVSHLHNCTISSMRYSIFTDILEQQQNKYIAEILASTFIIRKVDKFAVEVCFPLRVFWIYGVIASTRKFNYTHSYFSLCLSNIPLDSRFTIVSHYFSVYILRF